jgi:hypothetical protein
LYVVVVVVVVVGDSSPKKDRVQFVPGALSMDIEIPNLAKPINNYAEKSSRLHFRMRVD